MPDCFIALLIAKTEYEAIASCVFAGAAWQSSHYSLKIKKPFQRETAFAFSKTPTTHLD